MTENNFEIIMLLLLLVTLNILFFGACNRAEGELRGYKAGYIMGRESVYNQCLSDFNNSEKETYDAKQNL